MPTNAKIKSYESITKKGIERYKGSIRKKDEVIVIIGPIATVIPPHKRNQELVGEIGMYWVRSYAKVRGQWVLGMFDIIILVALIKNCINPYISTNIFSCPISNSLKLISIFNIRS